MRTPYRTLFDVAFAPMDPEVAHHLVFTGIKGIGHVPVLRSVIQGALAPYLGQGVSGSGSVDILGQSFPAPFGLAAGFDKDASAVRGLTSLGFAFVEVGTITPLPQPGNEQPRLWRDVDNDALRNAMGFNNDGAEAAAEQLRALRSTYAGRVIKVGVNIGKNKVTPADKATEDYVFCARELAPYADYLVVNVSSPNTPGLRDLQTTESLREILLATRAAADGATGTSRRVPLLVKIAPDLADADVVAVANLVNEIDIDGVVAVNTTIAHSEGAGGKSGPLLKARGIEVVELLRNTLLPGKAIIGCGGIATADDAEDYLRAGANLVQGYTGFIYQGPLWATKINRELTKKQF
jgi:dihydroorotate dehydrogenase